MALFRIIVMTSRDVFIPPGLSFFLDEEEIEDEEEEDEVDEDELEFEVVLAWDGVVATACFY